MRYIGQLPSLGDWIVDGDGHLGQVIGLDTLDAVCPVAMTSSLDPDPPWPGLYANSRHVLTSPRWDGASYVWAVMNGWRFATPEEAAIHQLEGAAL
jgi:hypothetical protein